jgi:hypothetical protein
MENLKEVLFWIIPFVVAWSKGDNHKVARVWLVKWVRVFFEGVKNFESVVPQCPLFFYLA